MKLLAVGLSLLVLVIYTRQVETRYCTKSYSCPSTCYRTDSYKTGCGWFRRCVKYRRVSYSCTKTCYKKVCCSGYKEQSCGGKSCVPICFGRTTCPNGGVCVAPNQCDKCSPGFAKPRCDVCSSSRLPRVAYGVYKQNRAIRGVASLSCNAGYEVTGDGTAVCGINGYWSPTASCRTAFCLQPSQNIVNGQYRIVHGTSVGNLALIVCKEARYVLQGGQDFVQCLPSGIWSTSSAKCVPVCPDGWLEKFDSCYNFGQHETNYTTARNMCLQMNSTLVTVNTVEENTYLKATMEELAINNTAVEPEYGYWNDLFEETTNGNEIWRDANIPLDSKVADWYDKQPDDNGGQQTCTMFWKDFGYQWADIECDAIDKPDVVGNRFGRALCEKRKVIADV